MAGVLKNMALNRNLLRSAVQMNHLANAHRFLSIGKIANLIKTVGILVEFKIKWHTYIISYIYLLGPARFREYVLTEKTGSKKNIGLITLNRPKALNALCDGLMRDLSDAIDEFEKDQDIAALIITGQGKAFAAGKKYWK